MIQDHTATYTNLAISLKVLNKQGGGKAAELCFSNTNSTQQSRENLSTTNAVAIHLIYFQVNFYCLQKLPGMIDSPGFTQTYQQHQKLWQNAVFIDREHLRPCTSTRSRASTAPNSASALLGQASSPCTWHCPSIAGQQLEWNECPTQPRWATNAWAALGVHVPWIPITPQLMHVRLRMLLPMLFQFFLLSRASLTSTLKSVISKGS